jgi:hypothetical protein
VDLGAFFWKETRLTGQGQGEGEGVPLTPRRFYHLHWYHLYHKSSTAQMALGAVGFPLTLPPGMVYREVEAHWRRPIIWSKLQKCAI